MTYLETKEKLEKDKSQRLKELARRDNQNFGICHGKSSIKEDNQTYGDTCMEVSR